MLEVVDLQAGYGDIRALFGVSFEVRERSIMAILGANGAGKSTILRAISGLLRPSGGEIRFEGERLTGRTPYDIAEMGIAHVPEGRRVFPSLSVEENLLVGSYSTRARPHRGRLLGEVYEMFPRLKERHRQSAGLLSGGEQQMLAIGRALMLSPRLLMMDEPSLGLAPILVSMVFEKIRAISRGGMTMLLVEQNAAACLTTALEGCVLEHGKVVCRGTRDQLLSTPAVREAYLGL
jgi:branched-chain amino acid transport system ATP-binding protein